MKLDELTEPFFQYLCTLSRSHRLNGQFQQASVRAELAGLLAQMHEKAAEDPALRDQFEKIELVLMFFADFTIKESTLSFAPDWYDLAYERNELTGYQRFFDLLDETLRDSSPAAAERLKIFYTCMGLGFTGAYSSQPELLRQKHKEILARISSGREFRSSGKICSDAYEHIDGRNLVQPPGTKLIGIVIALLGLVIISFVANAYLFRLSSQELRNTLTTIRNTTE